MKTHFCYLETAVVVEDSDFDKELDETEVKEEALRRFKELIERVMYGEPEYEIEMLIESEE